MGDSPAGPGDVLTPRVARESPAPGLFQLMLTRPRPQTVLLQLYGEFDQHQVARVAELLDARLRSLVHTVIVDCSGLSFLSVDALELLAGRALRARQHDIAFTVVTGQNPAVYRGCQVAGLGRLARVVPTVAEALPTAPGELTDTLG